MPTVSHRRWHRWPLTVALGVALAGCGDATDPPVAVPPPTTSAAPAAAPAAATSRTAVATTTAPTITAIESGATVTEPAERLDDDLVVTWIGGSDLELDGRSVPDAVAPLLADVDGRSIRLDVDTVTAPLPSDVAVSVERAADRNVDALVVSMSPSWTAWDGHDECAGTTPPHDYYLCVLTPRPSTDVGVLEAELAALVETIVSTGIPAFVYVIPHSTDALRNPTLERRLAAAEVVFEQIAPAGARVEYRPTILTRGIDDLREGVEFFDMVHPTEAGIDRLAPLFAAELDRFLGRQRSN